MLNNKMTEIMDESGIDRSLMRITHEIIERNKGTENLRLVGICKRGVPIAQRIADNIKKVDGTSIPVGELDITFYRDDLSKVGTFPKVIDSRLDFDVSDKKIILVDDVIYTGRTVRAAIEALFANGRPAEIQLAVLIDRGHRELPFRPDYVGKNIPTSKKESVSVRISETDGENRVILTEKSK